MVLPSGLVTGVLHGTHLVMVLDKVTTPLVGVCVVFGVVAGDVAGHVALCVLV